jgi:O-antigen ligase
VKESERISIGWLVLFLILHSVLALAMQKLPLVAQIHALVTLLVGLWLCSSKNSPLRVAQWVAYVVGAEVLWRMCRAPIPWEFAKHSIWLVVVISLLRNPGTGRGWGFPALFFVLLIPASAFTFINLPLDEARQQVSFYLAAPLCLTLCLVRFLSLRLTPSGFKEIGVMLLGPITGIAFLALVGMVTNAVEFSNNSNLGSSGGYGPNQISAMLSLGALMAVFMYLGENESILLRGGFAVLVLWLLAQAALTFSRTGLYLFGAALGLSAVFLLRWSGRGRRVVLLTIILASTASAAVPILDAFTGGQLLQRFEDKGLTGRDRIAEEELELWFESPILGKGVGLATYYRGLRAGGHAPPTHTEYTRLLAEHGLLGAGALAVLLALTTQAFLRTRGAWGKAVVAALCMWSFLFMFVSAMRLAAPVFLLALIHARSSRDSARPSRPSGPFRRIGIFSLSPTYHKAVGRDRRVLATNELRT